jgi:hypothetical protein
MMAMTPYEKKTLNDIEHAFFEAVDSQAARTKSLPTNMKKKTPPRRGWFAGLSESMVNSFVCCAPPQTLLDDDEIHEILAQIEAPVKPVLPRKDSLLCRNSASVMPASRTLDRSASCDDEPSLVVVEAPETEKKERAHVSLAAMQRVVVTLLALQKAAETRQTERAVLAVQMKWRRRAQVAPTVPAASTTAPAPAPVPVPTVSPPASPPTPTNDAEPDLEPKTVDDHAAQTSVPVASPKPRYHPRREPRPRAYKKTKFAFLPAAATQEPAVAVDALTQLALTRKRLRSVDVASCTTRPSVNVERNVHVLFGEEEIDDDDDDDEVMALGKGCSPRPVPCVALQRCASVPPPMTAFRPRAIKSKSLIEAQAASTLQRAWRNTKARREGEIQRRLAMYEAEKQSVMPVIRDQMSLLRKRLAEIQERNCSVTTMVAVAVDDEPAVIAPVDDDFDWL